MKAAIELNEELSNVITLMWNTSEFRSTVNNLFFKEDLRETGDELTHEQFDELVSLLALHDEYFNEHKLLDTWFDEGRSVEMTLPNDILQRLTSD